MKNKIEEPIDTQIGSAPEFISVCGILLFGIWAGACLFLPWQWSILMDEVSFNNELTNGSLIETIKGQFWVYWEAGRFYPGKMIANVLEWRLLPANPPLFHILHFLMVVCILGLGWKSLARRPLSPFTKIDRTWIPFFFGSALLAKPLLDAALHLSIGEGWATLFFAAGLFFLVSKSFFTSRFFWVLATLCKEPMAGVFMCSVLYQMILFGEVDRKKQFAPIILDFTLFLCMAAVAYFAMKQGTYLAEYSLTSYKAFKEFIYSALRLSFFLSPLILFTCLIFPKNPRFLSTTFADRRKAAWIAFHLSFIGGYLWLVTPRGSGGYLQVPVALSSLLLIFPFAVSGIAAFKNANFVKLILFMWIVVGLISVARWSAYAHAINNVSLVFPGFSLAKGPRLIIGDGDEMVSILRKEAARKKLSNIEIVEVKEFSVEKYSFFKGEVFVLQPWRYFTPLPKDKMQTFETWVKGWKVVEETPSHAVFFGIR